MQSASGRFFDTSDILTAGAALAGVFAAWLAFYYLAQMLIAIPTPFHDGTVWQAVMP